MLKDLPFKSILSPPEITKLKLYTCREHLNLFMVPVRFTCEMDKK